MYEVKQRKFNVDWRSLSIKMLILLAVLFIVLWVVAIIGKINEPKNVSNLTANLKTMQSAANEYFTGSRLPENINSKKKVTLGEMFDSKLLIEFKDQDNKSCNTTESYAEATKISEDNYTIKVKLVCGKEEDYVIDTVTIKTDNVIVDSNPYEDNTDFGDEFNEIPPVEEEPDTNVGNGNVGTVVSRPSNSGSSSVNVSAIYINYKKIYVAAGSSKSVMTVIYPTNATNKSVTWSSSNNSVATVNNGVITGVKAGNATITASAGGKSTTMEVQVLDVTNNGNVGVDNSSNGTCKYGVKDYANYTPAYIISGECAGAKSDYYNATYTNQVSLIGSNEYKKLVQETNELKAKTGADVYVESPVYSAVYNKANTGFVGYQIKFVVKVRQAYSSKSVYEYYLNTDSSRKVILDNRNSLTNSGNNNSNNGNNSNNNTTVEVSGITLNLTNFSIKVGETYTLVANVTPYNATNKSVTWSSSNSSVASVVNGKVTALKEGSATITAKAGAKVATAYVTVTSNNYLNILSPSNVSLSVNSTYNISYSSNSTASFRTSNAAIATVDANGRITARKSGDAIIYVTSNNIQKSINVTVKEDDYLTVYNTSLELHAGETKYIDYDSNRYVSFSSSDSSVAMVDSRGLITARSAGSATIYVTAGSLQRRVTVRVINNNPVSAGYKTVFANTSGGRMIDFNVVDPQVRVGSTIRLYAATNYYSPLLNWYSGNPYVATVDSNGNVTGLAEGTTDIYAMDERGVAGSYITVTVTRSGTNKGTTNTTIYNKSTSGRKIDFTVTNPKVSIGSTLQLTTNSNYTHGNYTWISMNDNIAKVDSNGRVTGLRAGTTTIMVGDDYATSLIVVEVI